MTGDVLTCNLMFGAISKSLRGLEFLNRVIEDNQRHAEESIQSAWRFHSTRSIVAGAVAVIDRLSESCVERGLIKSKEDATEVILDLLGD